MLWADFDGVLTHTPRCSPNRRLPSRRRGWPSATARCWRAKDANALAKLGMVYASLGDLNQAIPLLQQALTGKLITPTVIRLRVLQYRAGQAQAAAQTLAALPPGSDEARLAGIWGLMYGRR